MHTHENHNSDGLAPSPPPPRQPDGELSLGRRYAIAKEIAMAIPPGKSRVPNGSLCRICERYGFGPEYPSQLWKKSSQIDATQVVSISTQNRSGWSSLLTPTKVAALRTVN